VERIDSILQRSRTGKGTPIQILEEPEPTLEERREKLRLALGVASLDNTFENLKPWLGTEKAVATFKALASGKTSWKMLLEFGGVGNGKSHHCEATSIALYKRGLYCRVQTMDRLAGYLHDCLKKDSPRSVEDVIYSFSHSERLILDDVAGSEWEMQQLDKIIRYRYRENLFTVLTSNLDSTELPERIVSRFSDPEKGRLILNKGEDYRTRKVK